MIDPKVIQFLQNQQGGVLSTLSSKNDIDSAFVYFASNPKGDIYFVTSKDTQKFKNIQSGSRVSFVCVDEERLITIQAKGKAKTLTDPEEGERVYDLLIHILRQKLQKWPPPFTMMQDTGLVIVKVVFDWLRWGDFKCVQSTPLSDFFEQIIPKIEK